MKRVKILHCADLGIKNHKYGGINGTTGLNRRFEDVLKNFKFIVSQAINDNVDYFVIAGDINEERNPDSILIEKFSGFVADLISLDIKVIIVAGNHDVDSARGTSTSISYLKELGLVNTYIADTETETFEFDDAIFHCIPTVFPHQVGKSTNNEVSEGLDRYINSLTMTEGKPNILVSHYSLNSTFEGLNVDEITLNEQSLTKFDYVALGHIHKYQMSSIFTGGYSGSLFVKDFGEEKEKFINIVEFKGPKLSEIKKIQVPERIFEQFNIELIDGSPEEILEEIKSTVVNVKEKVVKIKITTRTRFNPKLIYDYLREQDTFHYVPVQWNIVTDDSKTTLKVEDGISDKDIVREYIKSCKLDDKTKEEVISYINTKVEKWEQEFGLS